MKKSKNDLIKKKGFILTLALLCLLTISFAQPNYSVTYTVVGGGGSGGGSQVASGGGGGGGGGGVITSNSNFSTGTYNIIVGSGGAVPGVNANGNNGGNSSITGNPGVTAFGGGGGGNGYLYGAVTDDGLAGGSGGGAGAGFFSGAATNSTGGTGTQGSNGGDTPAGYVGGAGGGGGGSSVQGGSPSNNSLYLGGTGGAGYHGYGGGGGGGNYSSGGAATDGGGAGGNVSSSHAVNGTNGTGGGGGGVYASYGFAGAGGTGIVILSFPDTINYGQTGGTVTTSGSNIIITYNSSGSFSIYPPTSASNPWIWGGNTGTCSGGVSQILGALDSCADLPIYAGGVECMFIESSTGSHPGFVGINTNTPGFQLDVNGSAHCSANMWTSSDKRFKRDITKLGSVNDKIKKLSGYSYYMNTEDFKGKNFSKEQQIGLIAQELKEVFPQLVTEDEKGYLAVNYQGMVPVLLEAIKDLQKQVDELKANNSANATNIPSANRMAINLTDKDVLVLNQNVPNPFAEQTVITYNILQSAGVAQLLFYDVNGRQIKAVDITTKGAGQLNVYANDLTNGIYSYTLIVDGKIIDTKRMIKQQ